MSLLSTNKTDIFPGLRNQTVSVLSSRFNGFTSTAAFSVAVVWLVSLVFTRSFVTLMVLHGNGMESSRIHYETER